MLREAAMQNNVKHASFPSFSEMQAQQPTCRAQGDVFYSFILSLSCTHYVCIKVARAAPKCTVLQQQHMYFKKISVSVYDT